MAITEANFTSLLRETHTEQLLILQRLTEIERDTPDTHEELQRLNGRAAAAWAQLEALLKWIDAEQPDPRIIGTTLADSFNLVGEILKEKTRIIEQTPPVIYRTNDDSSLN
jgi:hypothetical protein